MHPSAERALDLISTPRSPAQLLKASQAAWNEHGYPLTYACFMALVAFADNNFGGQGVDGEDKVVVIPRPPSEVIILAGRRRGEESLDMLNSLFTRVREADRAQTELAPGPTLEDLDKNYKGNAAYLMAYIVGSGVETLVEEGQDAERVLDSVRQFLEELSG